MSTLKGGSIHAGKVGVVLEREVASGQGEILWIAADATDIYWSHVLPSQNASAIEKAPWVQAAQTQVTTSTIGMIEVIALHDTRVYWVENGNLASEIRSTPK